MRNITILGATGSVGQQAADVACAYPDRIHVGCVSAHKDIKTLAKTANKLEPEYVAVTGADADIGLLKALLDYEPVILSSPDALTEACTIGEPDMVVLSVLGIAGLPAFEECLKHGITVALANKESLVCGGRLVQKMIRDTGTLVLPVDSEHSALFQCLNNRFDVSEVQRLWITASGGPFLHWNKNEIDHAPLEKALKHPRWSMGQKITIDSASLANKGLEVMEAHFMYGMPAERIKVLVHPQSIIHSMVEWKDGSVTAQMGPVDMRMPIQKSLLFPEMLENPCVKPLNFYEIGKLEFLEPDMERFPCLALAFEAIRTDTTAVYNSANEEAVAGYLTGKIEFRRIYELIGDSMKRFHGVIPETISGILELDKDVRAYVDALL
ncbi:1-deoxy-D-xylulose-5-phosphate reductoisomerase [Christensenella intestinihominis]|uniref:1-deoxy-D-xylulose-5-phosphate reductoisomerase n=1 Tax=Christensenella intestinihominis TaxID=1851429 RepID=UPI0008337ED8|nr:1-deoxy-D-xylulose-5-phosphate reductoisomerase [Christensenella intestinihominis]